LCERARINRFGCADDGAEHLIVDCDVDFFKPSDIDQMVDDVLKFPHACGLIHERREQMFLIHRLAECFKHTDNLGYHTGVGVDARALKDPIEGFLQHGTETFGHLEMAFFDDEWGGKVKSDLGETD